MSRPGVRHRTAAARQYRAPDQSSVPPEAGSRLGGGPTPAPGPGYRGPVRGQRRGGTRPAAGRPVQEHQAKLLNAVVWKAPRRSVVAPLNRTQWRAAAWKAAAKNWKLPLSVKLPTFCTSSVAEVVFAVP